MRIGYPLSESVAPPGTAWDAEGLRGNEANENKPMVLACARARKGQSGCRFAQEDVAVRLPAPGSRLPGVRLSPSSRPENPMNTLLEQKSEAGGRYFTSVTCSLFSSYTPNFFATGLRVG
jgi:hypothetical protein